MAGSDVNPLSANSTKWSTTLKQFVANLPTNCLSVFDHFEGLVLKGLRNHLDWLTHSMLVVPTQNLYLGPFMTEIDIFYLVGSLDTIPCYEIFLVVNLAPALNLEPI